MAGESGGACLGGGGGFVHDAAVEEMDDPVGVVCVAVIVGDHADGGALLIQFGEQIHDGGAITGVEIAGGFIGEEKPRLAGEGAGDGDALLLAAGELTGEVAAAVEQIDAAEGLGGHLVPLVARESAVGKGKLDIFEHIEVTDEIKALEDEANFAIADAGAAGWGQVGNIVAIEAVGSAGGRFEEADNGEQGGFAATGGAGDGKEFAGLDGQMDSGEGVGFDFIGEEDLDDSGKMDERLWGRHRQREGGLKKTGKVAGCLPFGIAVT